MTRRSGQDGHHRRVSRAAIILGSSTLVVVLAALVVWSLSRSYFVGAEANGKIAVYQGFPWDIAGGVRLYRLRYESPVLAGELSQSERRKLFGHDLRSYDAAVKAVKQYEAEVVPVALGRSERRNRELANLVAVGALTALGFASVYIARQDVISAGSISYALIFLGLYVAAHLVARIAVPWADPYLLPLAGPADRGRPDRDLPPRPERGVPPGLLDRDRRCRVLRDAARCCARDFRVLESYKYLFGLSAIGLLILPALPHFGTTINGARLWVRVGPLQFQPGELAKVALIVFLAGYLREKREVLAQGRLKDFGPLLLIWGAAMLVIVETNDLGSALLYFGIFLAMLYVATGRALYVAIGLGAVPRRRGGRLLDDLARRAARRLLAAPVERRARLLLPDRPGPVRDRQRQVRRHRPRPRDLHDDRRYRPDPVREQRLHLLRARAGARADRDLGASCSATWSSRCAASARR